MKAAAKRLQKDATKVPRLTTEQKAEIRLKQLQDEDSSSSSSQSSSDTGIQVRRRKKTVIDSSDGDDSSGDSEDEVPLSKRAATRYASNNPSKTKNN